MAFSAIAVASVAVSAYGAYNSAQQGNALAGIARDQNSRQAYFAQQLIDLMNNPDKVFDDPGYQALFGQGQLAVERSLAAEGFVGSGNAAIELQQFGQSFASNYYRDQQRLLASLSGAQFNPAAAGQAAQSSYDASYAQLGDALSSLGYLYAGSSGSGSPSAGSFGSETSVPGTMNAGGGYIYNIPGG